MCACVVAGNAYVCVRQHSRWKNHEYSTRQHNLCVYVFMLEHIPNGLSLIFHGWIFELCVCISSEIPSNSLDKWSIQQHKMSLIFVHCLSSLPGDKKITFLSNPFKTTYMNLLLMLLGWKKNERPLIHIGLGLTKLLLFLLSYDYRKVHFSFIVILGFWRLLHCVKT